MSDEKLSEVGVVHLSKAYEERLDIRADRQYVALMGAANISTKPYTANSASSGQIIWSQTTPSVRNGVDRNIELDVTADLDFSFTGGDPDALDYRMKILPGNNANCGLRAYPLHSVLQTVQLRLNDQAFSWEPAEQLHAILEYGLTPEDRQYAMGSTAHYPDQQWRFSADTGAQRNVFSSWISSPFEDSRAASIWVTGGAGDPTIDAPDTEPSQNSKNYKVRMVEQMMLSPLAYAEKVQCLFGIQNIDVSLTFRQPLERMLCGDWYKLVQKFKPPAGGGNPIWEDIDGLDDGLQMSVNVSFNQSNQKLHITYLQPQINQIIPWRLNYPFWQIQKFSQDLGSYFPNADIPVVYNNVTLHNIPKRMYLFAQPTLIQPSNLTSEVSYFGAFETDQFEDSQANVFQTDTFATVADVAPLLVNFDTQDGRFSTLDAYDLYKICSANGLKRSYEAWKNYVGAVICVEFGKDLNLNPLLCPGVRGNFQLSAQVNYRDNRNVLRTAEPSYTNQLGAKQYKAFMIIVNTGIVTIQNQLITSSIGSITEIQVEDAPWLKEGFRMMYKNVAGEGSKFSNVYSGIKHAIKTGSKHISPVADIVSGIADLSDDPRARTASKVAKAVSKATRGRGIVVGGQRASAHSLSRRM